MNGIFDFYTCKPIKGYWALYGFSDLADLGTHVESRSDDPDVYVTAACDENGSLSTLVSYYTNENGREEKTVTVDIGVHGAVTDVYTVDEAHSYELTSTARGKVTLTMKPNSFAVLKTRL